MKKVRIISLIMLLCMLLVLFTPSAYALEDPYLKSTDECLLIDIATGKALFSIEPDQNHSIASLTKIMTVLLAVEAAERGDVSLDDMVTASSHVRYGLDTSSSNADIVEGETMRYEDLLYCALVHSANDACNVLAEYIGGSIQQFVTLMNNRAKEIGCTNTQFNDTCGMLNRSDGHYSCAHDLYLITMEAMSHPLFYTVCNTVDYTVPATNVHAERELHNSNALISNNGLYGSGYLYDGTVGVKTGFTKPAGYCLVSTCEKNGLHLMCIVLGCNGPLTYTSVPGEYQNFMDSATLYDWAFNNFAYKTVFLAGERLKRMNVQYAADSETVAIAPDQNLELLLAKDILDSQIHVEVNVDESSLVAPIEAGQKLGTISVYVSDELYATCNAIAATSVQIEKSQAVKSSIKNFFTSKGFKIAIFSVIGLIVLIVVASLYIKLKRRERLRAKMRAQERKRIEQKRIEQQHRTRPRYDDYEREDESFTPRRFSNYEYEDTVEYEEEEIQTPTAPQRRQEISSNYEKPSVPETSNSGKWEEGNLDDILRSLGIDPDNLGK